MVAPVPLVELVRTGAVGRVRMDLSGTCAMRYVGIVDRRGRERDLRAGRHVRIAEGEHDRLGVGRLDALEVAGVRLAVEGLGSAVDAAAVGRVPGGVGGQRSRLLGRDRVGALAGALGLCAGPVVAMVAASKPVVPMAARDAQLGRRVMCARSSILVQRDASRGARVSGAGIVDAPPRPPRWVTLTPSTVRATRTVQAGRRIPKAGSRKPTIGAESCHVSG